MSSSDATPQPAAGRSGANDRTWPAGWNVQIVEETGSTNDDLLAAAEAGAPNRSVLATRHQTAGRGRLDRKWDAPPGANLLVSLLIRDIPEHLHQVTQRVALAACAAVAEVTGVRPELKWPNDLLLDGRKLAGVLAQAGRHADPRAPGEVTASGQDYGVAHVVVGIGLNVRWAPDGAASLGDDVDPLDVLASMLAAYDRLPTDIAPAYRAALGTLGQRVRVERPGGVVEGRAVDVEPDGRLVVIDECAITHRIDTGDVIHLRPVDGH